VAEVKGHGQKYEESLKEMEKDNPRYSFLTDRRVSSSHIMGTPQLTVRLSAPKAPILSIVIEEG
jgi:hypothetical protein